MNSFLFPETRVFFPQANGHEITDCIFIFVLAPNNWEWHLQLNSINSLGPSSLDIYSSSLCGFVFLYLYMNHFFPFIQPTNIYQVFAIHQALNYVLGSQWKWHTHSLYFQEDNEIVTRKVQRKRSTGCRAPGTDGLGLILWVSGLPQAGDICTEIYRALTKKRASGERSELQCTSSREHKLAGL